MRWRGLRSEARPGLKIEESQRIVMARSVRKRGEARTAQAWQRSRAVGSRVDVDRDLAVKMMDHLAPSFG